MSNVPGYNRLNKDDAVVLLVDHQTGLISLVQDFSPNEFKNNVLALGDVAKFFKLPNSCQGVRPYSSASRRSRLPCSRSCDTIKAICRR